MYPEMKHTFKPEHGTAWEWLKLVGHWIARKKVAQVIPFNDLNSGDLFYLPYQSYHYQGGRVCVKLVGHYACDLNSNNHILHDLGGLMVVKYGRPSWKDVLGIKTRVDWTVVKLVVDKDDVSPFPKCTLEVHQDGRLVQTDAFTGEYFNSIHKVVIGMTHKRAKLMMLAVKQGNGVKFENLKFLFPESYQNSPQLNALVDVERRQHGREYIVEFY